MRRIQQHLVCRVFLLLVLMRGMGFAQQPASTLEELRSALRVRIGDSVQVTDRSGSRFSGRIEELSPDSLRLIVRGAARDFPETNLHEVRARRPEPGWDGVVIGLGAGAAAGAVGTVVVCGANDSECSFYSALVLVPVFAGIGAGTGALIDFAIKRYDTVFLSPEKAAGLRFRLSPIVARQVKGLRLSVSF